MTKPIIIGPTDSEINKALNSIFSRVIIVDTDDQRTIGIISNCMEAFEVSNSNYWAPIDTILIGASDEIQLQNQS